jgi:hypothetical protein
VCCAALVMHLTESTSTPVEPCIAMHQRAAGFGSEASVASEWQTTAAFVGRAQQNSDLDARGNERAVVRSFSKY